MPRRVLVIGLDGGTMRLLGPLMAAGVMPELARLMQQGCHGELRSTFPPLTPPAWSAFMTGKNPGKHGVVSFRRAPKGYRTGDFINARTLRARTLWEIVGDAGYTVGAMHVVPSYPVRPVNGFMVSCMLSPPGAKDIIYPPEFRALLGDDYVISLEPPTQLAVTDPTYRQKALDYVGRLRQLGRRRLEAALRLVRERPCDLLAVIFYEPDRVQHFFWKDMDPHHPRHTAEGAALFANAIHDVWVRDDQILGDLLAALPPDATVMMLSDHGFDAIYRQVNLANWLPKTDMPHWLATLAVPKMMMTNGLVHHWLQGQVPGSSDREVFIDKFIDLCKNLQDPQTGVHPFESLFRREDIYSGRMVEKAPDVVFQESPKYYVTKGNADSTGLPTIQDIWSTSFSAHHRPQGILAIRSPNVHVPTQGTLRERLAKGGDFKDAHIIDVSPTLLALMQQIIPDDMDGRVLQEAITQEFLTQHPPQTGHVEGFLLDRLPPSKLTPEEREKLKALPYLQ